MALWFGQYFGFVPAISLIEGQAYLVLEAALAVFSIGWIGVGLNVLLRQLPSAKQVSSGKPVA